MASENVTIWTSQQFTGPFVAGESFATSSEIANLTGFNSARLAVEFEAIDPDGKDIQVGFLLEPIIEEEVANGVWVPVATTYDKVKGTDEPVHNVTVLSPGQVLDPGVAEKVGGGSGGRTLMSISRTDGVAPEKYRVCILYHETDSTKPQLTSVTLSAWVRKFSK